MKTTILSIIFSTAMSFTTLAQDCSTFYPFFEGAKTQITTYDKRGRVSAVSDYVVTSVTGTSNNKTAALTVIIKDERDRELVTSEYDLKCNGDAVSIDFKSMVGPQFGEQFRDMEYEITGTNLVYPNNMSIGNQLPDAAMQMQINMSGINMNLNMAVTDRKVIAKESVTVPAGTYECFVIEYNVSVEMGLNRNSKSKQWIARGVGLVKQEDYNGGGRITSSSKLTAFSR